MISEIIQSSLDINVAVLMGANLAPEVASENFCEATIGTENIQGDGVILKKLFHTDYFRINVVRDAHTVELCGALKVGTCLLLLHFTFRMLLLALLASLTGLAMETTPRPPSFVSVFIIQNNKYPLGLLAIKQFLNRSSNHMIIE